jgi:FkbM family methyltransferase
MLFCSILTAFRPIRHRHAGDAGVAQGLVVDEPAGEIDHNWRDGTAATSSPDCRTRHPTATVPAEFYGATTNNVRIKRLMGTFKKQPSESPEAGPTGLCAFGRPKKSIPSGLRQRCQICRVAFVPPLDCSAMLSTKQKIEIARLLNWAIIGARSVVGRPSRVVVRRRKVTWKLDLSEGIDFAIYLGLYQRIPARVTRWIMPGALVLDIGANIGAHSFMLAQVVGPHGHVIAIEPTDYGFSCLKANAALNSDLLPRLILIQAALTAGEEIADQNGQPRFYSRWPLNGGGDVQRHPKHMGELETAKGARFVRLDTLLAEIRAERGIDQPIAFIKLDVDGHELDVLQGAAQTLTAQRPPILIEIAPYVQDEVPGRLETVLETLKWHGYQLETAQSGEKLPMSASALRTIITDGGGIDAIARAG